MFANYLIGLREGLEAALVVVILLAYLMKIGRRDLVPGVWSGVALAAALSLGFGALLTYGTHGLTFEAQETIGGLLSIIAVGLVTWMVFWMAKTAKNLRGELHGRVDRQLAAGGGGLVVVAFLAVGREGLETALFLWSAVRATGQTTQPILGAALGLASAVVLGWLFYRGMLRINLAKFFTWTGGMLIIVAAGVLSYGIHDLQEANILPGLHTLMFDLSAAVPPSSWYGTLLKGTVNFSPATTWFEGIAWLLYTIPVMTLFMWQSGRRTPAPATAQPPVPQGVQ